MRQRRFVYKNYTHARTHTRAREWNGKNLSLSVARASPLEWLLERVNTRFLSFGLLQPGPAPNNNNEIGVRGCDNEETMEERGRSGGKR